MHGIALPRLSRQPGSCVCVQVINNSGEGRVSWWWALYRPQNNGALVSTMLESDLPVCRIEILSTMEYSQPLLRSLPFHWHKGRGRSALHSWPGLPPHQQAHATTPRGPWPHGAVSHPQGCHLVIPLLFLPADAVNLQQRSLLTHFCGAAPTVATATARPTWHYASLLG